MSSDSSSTSRGVVCHHLCRAPKPQRGLLSLCVPRCNVQCCCQDTRPAGLFILHGAKMLLNCTIQISTRKIARLFFFHIKLANLLVYVIVKNAKHPIQVINLSVNKSNNCMCINNIIKGTFISK